jgi:hypothetical protein
MSKIESRIIKILNKILYRFNKQISSHGKYYIIHKGKVDYECVYCKKGQIALPDFKYQKYSYELQDLPHIESQNAFKLDDESYGVYGWAIERRSTTNPESKWKNSSPHKIYDSRETALDSIIQLKSTEDPWIKRYSYEYRIKPIYHIESTEGMRNVLINKILNQK